MTSLNAVSTLFGGTAPHRLEELYGVGFSDDGVAPASGPINLRAFNGKTPLRFSEQRAKLVASDSGNGDKFGSSVDVDGDTAVIGSIANDDHGTNSGSAYIFTRDTAGDTTSSWTQRVKLTASDAAAFDYFGGSQSRDGVAIDGDTVAISAVGGDNKSSRVKVGGAVYVFTRDTPGSLTSGWTQRAKLVPSDTASRDNFGISVSIDGDTMVIGSYGTSYRGAAYVFRRTTPGTLTSGWTQVTKMTASDPINNALFGISLSLSSDTVVIGARSNNSAYIFTRDTPGSLTSGWTQRAKLTASDGVSGDQFGENVSIDGDTVVIGANRDDDNGNDSGSVYIFNRDAAGNWTQSAKLTAADASSPDDFGVHVTIEEDTIVIGARFKSVNGYSLIGSAYVFTRNAAGNWTQHSKLLASDGTLSNSPTFGDNVAISGNTMLIAASGTGNGPGFGAGEPDSGAVYVFTLEITPINP